MSNRYAAKKIYILNLATDHSENNMKAFNYWNRYDNNMELLWVWRSTNNDDPKNDSKYGVRQIGHVGELDETTLELHAVLEEALEGETQVFYAKRLGDLGGAEKKHSKGLASFSGILQKYQMSYHIMQTTSNFL